MAGPLAEMPSEIKNVMAAGDMGAGKSVWIGQEIGKVARALVIMHRRGLSREIASTMGISDYQTVEEQLINRADHPRLVITPNSLDRLPLLDGEADDLIVIEEVEATLSHWYGGTMKRARQYDGEHPRDPVFGELVGGDAFARLLEMIDRCVAGGGRLILSDAFPGSLTARFIEVVCQRLGLAPDTAVRCIFHSRPVDWSLHVHEELADVVARIEEDVRNGKRVVVACTSARTAVALSQAALTWVRNDGNLPKVLCHHQGQDAAARDALKNVHESWSTPDLVIYSPSVDAGISYDRTDTPLNRRYLIAIRPRTNRTGTPIPGFGWRTPMQMSRRVRDVAVRDPDIRASIDPGWRHDQTCDPDTVRADMAERGNLAIKVAEDTDPDGRTYDTALRDPEHFEVGVAVEVSRRRDTANVPRLVREAFSSGGAEVVEHATELDRDTLRDFRKHMTALKRDADNRQAREWFAASPLTSNELSRLHGGRAEIDDRTRASMERSRRVEFFGPIGAEFERLMADLRGEERALVRRHVRLRLVAEGQVAAAALYDRACAEPGYRVSTSLTMVHAAAAWEMLRAGFGLEILPGYKRLADGGPLFRPEKMWAQDPSPEEPENTPETGEDEVGPGPEDSIALEGGPNTPILTWGTVPTGVTLDDIRDAFDLPALVDSREAETAVVEVARNCGGASILEGSGLPIHHMRYPNASVKRLWKVAGYKVTQWKNTHVGPSRKRVRIYSLDEAWLETLLEISGRHYELARGHQVPPLELIDPRADELQRKQSMERRRMLRLWSRQFDEGRSNRSRATHRRPARRQ